MKKIILFIALAMSTLFSVAQTADSDYHPFLKDGKVWNYLYRDVNVWEQSEKTELHSYLLDGDMTIGDKNYKKMFRVTPDGTEFYCALREENRRVLMHVDDAEEDMLLYDFNFASGDSYIVNYHNVEFIDSEVMRFHDKPFTIYHYKYWLYEPLNGNFLDIVEGVGTRKGWNINECFREFPTNGIYQVEDFMSCYEDGECIFTIEDFDVVQTDIKSVNHSQERTSDIYTLQGQRVESVPRKGVYIQNGKKVVIKIN